MRSRQASGFDFDAPDIRQLGRIHEICIGSQRESRRHIGLHSDGTIVMSNRRRHVVGLFGIGPRLAEPLNQLASPGCADQDRILNGLPRPSGASAERIPT
jgi:hypothetical protein